MVAIYSKKPVVVNLVIHYLKNQYQKLQFFFLNCTHEMASSFQKKDLLIFILCFHHQYWQNLKLSKWETPVCRIELPTRQCVEYIWRVKLIQNYWVVWGIPKYNIKFLYETHFYLNFKFITRQRPKSFFIETVVSLFNYEVLWFDNYKGNSRKWGRNEMEDAMKVHPVYVDCIYNELKHIFIEQQWKIVI